MLSLEKMEWLENDVERKLTLREKIALEDEQTNLRHTLIGFVSEEEEDVINERLDEIDLLLKEDERGEYSDDEHIPITL